MAKAVVVQYGEPTGPPLLATKDAVTKEAFMAEPQLTMTSGDAQGVAVIVVVVVIYILMCTRCIINETVYNRSYSRIRY